MIVITIIGFTQLFRSSYEPKLLFDLGIAILPLLISWIVIGSFGDAFNLHVQFRTYLKRTALLWFVASIAAQIIRTAANYFINHSKYTIIGLVINIIDISILFLVWRILLKVFHQESSRSSRSKNIILWCLVSFGVICVLATIPYIYATIRYSNKIYSSQDTPAVNTALVFGAGVWSDNTPSNMLKSRLETAAELYHQDKIQHIILSGSEKETKAMLQSARDLQINENDLSRDNEGYSTLDSCLNLMNVKSQSEFILISQKYHLTRALFICNSLGVTSIGVKAKTIKPLPEVVVQQNLIEIIATDWTIINQ